MAPPFHRLSIEEFAGALDLVPCTRRINAIHLHHTWRPNHSQYTGYDTIVSMWRYHTQVNGWSDIAQHLTVDPEGKIWTGRNWNQPPVSAAGHNGNRTAGPFMVALIGDFDHGRDRLQDEQRRTAVQLIALLQRKFRLARETLRFHSQMSSKSCPGTAVDWQELLDEVRGVGSLGGAPAGAAGAPAEDSRPFDEDALVSHAVIEALAAKPSGRDDPADAEPLEDAMTDSQLRALFRAADGTAPAGRGTGGEGRTLQDAPLPPEILTALRPHVVNLNLGMFSTDGQFATTPGDVDAIFHQHLLRELEGARARKEPLRLVFYAHGGLVKESAGLRMAEKHVGWWKRNNVYPIYFVWETGLFETIAQLLRRSRQAVRGVTRDIFDYTTDPLLEGAVRSLYAPRIWSGMKRSAELGAAPGGGARHVAQRLKEFCDEHRLGEEQIELHAVGHSAGAIFQAQFLPVAHELGLPSFRTVHFLAPALRVDTFHERLGARLGKDKGIDHLTVFTMYDALERNDDCNTIYRKSLLYLISRALEPEPRAPIMGLETCLRNDARLRELLGLGAARSQMGEVVWSATTLDSGRGASRSAHHGDFDDDVPTMNSVVRRVLGLDDNDPIKEFPAQPAGARGRDLWADQVDWPADMDFLVGGGGADGLGAPAALPPAPLQPYAQPYAAAPAAVATPVTVPGVATAPLRPPGATAGRRRALCVGINDYPTAPLYGCVADSVEWQAALTALAFQEIDVLQNRDATRDRILQALERIVSTSVAGDVVVFQFAGHGTQLADTGGDEADGDTPGQDEAICPIDFADGAFVVDDDLGEILEQTPPGVNVTCFIDCCHSGTISRFGVGAPAPARGAGAGPRPRFIPADAQLLAAHQRFRRSHDGGRTVRARGLSRMTEVLFAACLSSEVAYEDAGHGDFTSRATRLLRAQPAGLTNEQFVDRLITEFGAAARQHPRLYCRPEGKVLGLLQPLDAAGSVPAIGANAGNWAAAPGGQAATAAQLLRLAAAVLEGLPG